ncbi:hypothetical protein C1885_21085 [Pseudomonas sp. GW531-R1]|nr:hypothetical protein C1885_21085 [Pseudomonas sp. GW531-R1]
MGWLTGRHRGQAPSHILICVDQHRLCSILAHACAAEPPGNREAKGGRGLAPDSGGSVNA